MAEITDLSCCNYKLLYMIAKS